MGLSSSGRVGDDADAVEVVLASDCLCRNYLLLGEGQRREEAVNYWEKFNDGKKLLIIGSWSYSPYYMYLVRLPRPSALCLTLRTVMSLLSLLGSAHSAKPCIPGL